MAAKNDQDSTINRCNGGKVITISLKNINKKDVIVPLNSSHFQSDIIVPLHVLSHECVVMGERRCWITKQRKRIITKINYWNNRKECKQYIGCIQNMKLIKESRIQVLMLQFGLILSLKFYRSFIFKIYLKNLKGDLPYHSSTKKYVKNWW